MEIADKKFEDIEIGDSEELEHIFYSEDIEKFAELSGDHNPLHLDEEYARETQFKKPIVYGALVFSLISRLIGMRLPGKRALYLSQNLIYRRPVYIGDKLTVKGEVITKSESTRIITLKTIIKNRNDDIVLDGEAKVKIL